ncbi:MAG: hypothetical protein ACLFUL_02105 [Desulfobacteraceae bacterium]
MVNEMEELSQSKDVGFLLTRLRLAKSQNEVDVTAAIVDRLREIEVLKDKGEMEERPFENLRIYVEQVLGEHA